MSIEAVLCQALSIAVPLNAGIDYDRVMNAWRRTNPRADVDDDFQIIKTIAIQGSPQIMWPDGATTHNSGMTDHRWTGGLVRIGKTDEHAAELPSVGEDHPYWGSMTASVRGGDWGVLYARGRFAADPPRARSPLMDTVAIHWMR